MTRRSKKIEKTWLKLASLAALGLGMAGSGCGGSDADAAGGAGGSDDVQPHYDYPLDDVLRVTDLQVKGTHNSYHIEKDGNTLSDWHYTHVPLDQQLNDQGVRAVELDTHYDEVEDVFHVYHLPALDELSTCDLLTDCLRALKNWSDAHRAHHLLFIQIEPKSGFPTQDPEPYFKSFEAAIQSVWPKHRILTPDQVRGDAASLPEAVASKGFPTLGETRGNVLFFFDDHADVRDAYTRGGSSLEGRLAFVDSSPADAYGAVAVLNDPVGEASAIADALAAGFLVRTRADDAAAGGDPTRAEQALASGAQIVTTDFPAPTADTPYSVQIPGGTPSRCNPVVAPAACTSEAVEDPVFVGP